ncbi:hypothetical protein J7M28_08770 [bacterium]|nr:hypothetical protein [bacterium]
MSSFQLSVMHLIPAIALPFVLAGIGRLLSPRANPSAGSRLGFSIGLVGPIAILLYIIYSLLCEALGLASLLNIFSCSVVAVLMGLCWGRFIKRAFADFKHEER